ncbi:transcriptional regulator [Leptospira montravelensis]|uniref:Transcriptional regulator n=1 Tax=Leptospira montravelensis TaxID=2484961 RepID=A0ABY2LQM5_9LEPT|nr:MltR family transcriptional regulator [Leptospira montravelensis]TGK78657.1 transcriptional regulator [Leptospira montravelensis]TGL02361.1 transcriptional regulator [Leptospira montravelensis]
MSNKTDPEIIELSQFLNEFNKESDRGAVLVSTSLIDEWLMKMLFSYFADVKSSKDLIERFNAPLGTFSSKIKIAYSLGLLQENEYNEINIIRKIRNEFGHSWKDIDFKNSTIIQFCNMLPWLGPKELEKESNARERFNFTVVILLTDLMWRDRLIKKEKCKIRTWPNKSRN